MRDFTLQWTAGNQSELWTLQRCVVRLEFAPPLRAQESEQSIERPRHCNGNEVLNLTLHSKSYIFLLSRIYNKLKGKGGKYHEY